VQGYYATSGGHVECKYVSVFENTSTKLLLTPKALVASGSEPGSGGSWNASGDGRSRSLLSQGLQGRGALFREARAVGSGRLASVSMVQTSQQRQRDEVAQLQAGRDRLASLPPERDA
jgi:hypothetical protein